MHDILKSSRRFGSTGLCAIVLAFTGAVSIHCAQSKSTIVPERIILIVVDTLRRDHVSAYSTSTPATTESEGPTDPDSNNQVPIQTPNIDRLATSGQTFTNAVSAFHSTTMSMAALFTGRTPSIESDTQERTLEWNSFAFCGMTRFSEPGTDDACVPKSLNTLAEDLKGAGYWTLGVVSNKLLYRPAGYDQGFDEWVELGVPAAGPKVPDFEMARLRSAREVNRNALAALETRPNDRFFLYLHYIDVHDFSLSPRTYKASVEKLDRRLGELLDQLRADGLLEDSTVIFTSDHGEMFVDQHLGLKVTKHFGNPAFEPVLRIPLIVTPPIDADPEIMIRSQDIRPMIARIAGLDGAQPTDLRPDELFLTEMFYQTYREGSWKSIWDRRGAAPMLFDLVADPGEEEDLSAQHGDILTRHRERIDELSRSLASTESQIPNLSDEDIDRLRALGYIDSTKDVFWNK